MEVTTILGACGLECSGCDAYKATQAGDAEAIAKVAEAWTKQFGGDIKPESVWCDGCKTDGARKCGHTAECGIRACTIEKNVENCAGCGDYACEQLSSFFEMVPCCKGRLEAARGAVTE